METVIDNNLVLDNELKVKQRVDSVSAANVADLLDSKIVIAGANISDVAFMQTMLKISGFSDITCVHDGAGVITNLRQGIRDDVCDVDLIVLDNNLTDMSALDLRLVMDQFDEWRLIPIITLTKELQWDHKQVLTDLGHGVTSLLYRPLTAESFPPAVMTALAVKKERDEASQREMQLEDELAVLKVMEARLQFSVTHDDLTGLANRRSLERALDLTLTKTLNFNSTSALFYIDLDSFKVLNDAQGHEAGDALLIQIANTLRGYFSVDDTLVRIGSDEYAVLVDDIDENLAMIRAEGLRTLFDGYRFEFNDHLYHLSVSIGIKIITGVAKSSSGEILSHANQACFTAKSRGRNCVHLFNPDDREMLALHHSVKWAPRIRTALKQESFVLEFQPIHSLAAARITHYECLIRMRGDDSTLYYPNDFIPVAEAMGLIQQIDLWVVSRAFDLMSTISPDVSITINLSGNTFLDYRLYPLVERKIAQTGVDPHRIVFEITETSAISNFDLTKEMVERLRHLGIRFALDDFGAGFNSYSYLKHFPVDILKIDGGFITNLVNDPVDQLLVKSMIEVAHSLGKKTVAEFVENQETKELLASYGVDFAQGYLIGKPQDYLPGL